MNNKEFQYYHHRESYCNSVKEEFTAVCKVPTNEDLLKLIDLRVKYNINVSIEMLFGITKVHPKDNYCKKIGREKSMQNMMIRTFWLENIVILSHSICFNFVSNNIGVTLEYKNERSKPYLIGVRM